MVHDGSFTPAVRVEALKALARPEGPGVRSPAQGGLGQPGAAATPGARAIWVPGVAPEEAARQLAEVLDKGTTLEKQGTFALLADLGTARRGRPLVEVARPARRQQGARGGAARYSRSRPAPRHAGAEDAAGEIRRRPARRTTWCCPIAPPWPAATRNEAATSSSTAPSSRACAATRSQARAATSAPTSPASARRFPRAYLLEAIVDPNRQIAKGFETVVLALQNGQIKSGILKSEDAKEVRLMNAEGQMIVVPKADIEERSARQIGDAGRPDAEDDPPRAARPDRVPRGIVAGTLRVPSAERRVGASIWSDCGAGVPPAPCSRDGRTTN